MTKAKIKEIISYLLIIIVLLIIIALVYNSLTKETYKYKLELSDLVFFSDENILEKINQIKDANSIAIVLDQTETSDYSAGNAILYTQIFASQKKRIFLVQISKDEECSTADTKTLETINSTKAVCLEKLQNINYPKIMLGKTKNNEKTNVEIKDNYFYVISKSANTAYQENHRILEIIYPNINEIETAIQNYVGKVSDIIDKKNT